MIDRGIVQDKWHRNGGIWEVYKTLQIADCLTDNCCIFTYEAASGCQLNGNI